MKHFQRALYNREGSQLNLSFDLQKSEGSGRVVTGFATLDNVDFGNDIVAAGASLKAFSNFRGNVRVQHDKLRPVGRVLDFAPATVFDEKTQKSYEGVKVAVYISEGAEDTWKMVQDGTLSGFSIGGAVLKASKVYREDIEKTVQVIEEYALLELSLVDSPMNGLANIVSVHKSLDSAVVVDKGYDVLNLFYCGTDKIASKSKGSDAICPVCGEAMVSFGQTNENESVQKSLEKVFEELKNDTKGGHPIMSDEIKKDAEGTEGASNEAVNSTDETVETPAAEENTEVEETTEEAEPLAEAAEVAPEPVVEEIVNSEEVVEETKDKEEPNVSELLAELKGILEEATKETAKSTDELRDELRDVSANLEKKLSELDDKYVSLEKTTGDIKEKLNTASTELDETKKRLDEVADAAPIKKSLDSIQHHEEPKSENQSVFKGLWSGNLG